MLLLLVLVAWSSSYCASAFLLKPRSSSISLRAKVKTHVKRGVLCSTWRTRRRLLKNKVLSQCCPIFRPCHVYCVLKDAHAYINAIHLPPQALHATTIPTARSTTSMTVTAADITTAGKLSETEATALSDKYKGLLYLATDNGADKGIEPNGFASLQGVAARHVPVDVKVRSREGTERGEWVVMTAVCPTFLLGGFVCRSAAVAWMVCPIRVVEM